MSNLVSYASSDEESDTQPERPSKIARTEKTGEVPIARPAEVNKTNLQLRDAPSVQTQIPAQPTQPQEGPLQPSQGPSVSRETEATISAPSLPLSITPYEFERQRIRELTMPTVPNFDIPDSPPPPERNSEEAAELAARTKKFEKFLELKKKGVHFNARLQNSSSLKNPSLLPKLMEFAGISHEDSYASSLPDDLGIRRKWPKESYIENLMKQNERREKKRLAERDKVDFVPASNPPAN